MDYINDTCVTESNDTAEIAEDVMETDYLLFLSPQILALMEPDILSQLRTYKPSPITARCGVQKCPPHNKSYLRVLSRDHGFNTTGISNNNNNNNINDVALLFQPTVTESLDEKSNCKCTDLAWFLLTSACLSQGTNQYPFNRLRK